MVRLIWSRRCPALVRWADFHLGVRALETNWLVFLLVIESCPGPSELWSAVVLRLQ